MQTISKCVWSLLNCDAFLWLFIWTSCHEYGSHFIFLWFWNHLYSNRPVWVLTDTHIFIVFTLRYYVFEDYVSFRFWKGKATWRLRNTNNVRCATIGFRTAVFMKFILLGTMTCGLENNCQRFEGVWCFHLECLSIWITSSFF